MCCQITPAIGHEPMKPMTMTRFRFMRSGAKKERTSNARRRKDGVNRREKTPNAQRPTPNVQLRGKPQLFCLNLGVERWALDVGRFSRSRKSRLVLELLDHDGGVAGHDRVCWNAFCDNGTGGDHGIFSDRHAFQNRRVHSDPDVISDDDGDRA